MRIFLNWKERKLVALLAAALLVACLVIAADLTRGRNQARRMEIGNVDPRSVAVGSQQNPAVVLPAVDARHSAPVPQSPAQLPTENAAEGPPQLPEPVLKRLKETGESPDDYFEEQRQLQAQARAQAQSLGYQFGSAFCSQCRGEPEAFFDAYLRENCAEIDSLDETRRKEAIAEIEILARAYRSPASGESAGAAPLGFRAMAEASKRQQAELELLDGAFGPTAAACDARLKAILGPPKNGESYISVETLGGRR